MTSPPGRWVRNHRGEYELIIATVYTAAVLPPPRGLTLYRWRLYARPDITGESRSLYAAQRAVRRALREGVDTSIQQETPETR